MNAFSKKTDLTLLIVSTAAFIASIVVIAYSPQIFTFIQNLIETKVLHRPLNPAMIRQKITPFIGFPVFTVIFFDALFFVKFSKKNENNFDRAVFYRSGVFDGSLRFFALHTKHGQRYGLGNHACKRMFYA
mgnify:FL=1